MLVEQRHFDAVFVHVLPAVIVGGRLGDLRLRLRRGVRHDVLIPALPHLAGGLWRAVRLDLGVGVLAWVVCSMMAAVWDNTAAYWFAFTVGLAIVALVLVMTCAVVFIEVRR